VVWCGAVCACAGVPGCLCNSSVVTAAPHDTVVSTRTCAARPSGPPEARRRACTPASTAAALTEPVACMGVASARRMPRASLRAACTPAAVWAAVQYMQQQAAHARTLAQPPTLNCHELRTISLAARSLARRCASCRPPAACTLQLLAAFLLPWPWPPRGAPRACLLRAAASSRNRSSGPEHSVARSDRLCAGASSSGRGLRVVALQAMLRCEAAGAAAAAAGSNTSARCSAQRCQALHAAHSGTVGSRPLREATHRSGSLRPAVAHRTPPAHQRRCCAMAPNIAGRAPVICGLPTMPGSTHEALMRYMLALSAVCAPRAELDAHQNFSFPRRDR
jgi:hypothetical protein